ncbi:MAG: hypothetical protein D6754_09490 [Alphaproteobacteria bacterium]|nr:MAG: hypothetical protein D6754_09490 [Alphaproteobacteria bacterium]
MVTERTGTLQPGEVLNNTYIIEELVGAGGTGEVYRARNRVSGREMAIKTLRREFATSETFLDLMRREASVLHEVVDDAVVRYHDLLESEAHGGFIFLVMEFIRGESLAERMKRDPLDADTCLVVARRIAQGLRASHQKKAYHRDLSPDNVILRDGDPARAVLIDFGIAKDVSEDARTVIGGGFAGKYQYAAPEQIEGNVDARSDLYSLGMTLIGAFRGKPPAAGANYLEIIRTKAEKPDISDLPGKLGELVDRLVDPDPARRFQSASEVLAFLDGDQPVAEERPARERRDVPPPGIERPRRGREERKEGSGGSAGIWITLLLLVAVLGGAGWYLLLGPGRELVFGPEFPLADPYRMEITYAGPGSMRVLGHAPNPEAAAAVMSALSALNEGDFPEGAVKAASGMPTPGWNSAVLAMARAAATLNLWSLSVSGTVAELTGEAESEEIRHAAVAAATAAAQEGGLTLETLISVVPPALALEDVRAVLNPISTCGPLTVSGGNGETVPPGGRITVTGRVAQDSDKRAITNTLAPLIGDRQLELQLEPYSVPVCQVLTALPPGPDPSIRLEYGYGKKAGTTAEDIYHQGENPVIDILLPAGRTGFVSAFYVNFEGSVFHLIPHNLRQEHEIAHIGTVEGAQRRIRLSWPLDEASPEKLGFNVMPPFGIGAIVVLVSEKPFLDGLRPRGDPLETFLPLLRQGLRAQPVSHAYRFLITAP